MRYGSVCSGIEAATVAWHPLGWKPAFFSEIDTFPRAALAHHYPSVPCHGDFTTIGADEYGSIDLLVGGTPCQSFSVAGLRKGLADDRGNLTLEFIRLAERKKPRWILWENVPGVLSIDGGRAFGSFLGGLAECGYGFAYRVLDAQYFGVPQRRRRVFVVGYLGDWRPAAAVLFERESLRGDITPSREKGEGVAGYTSTSFGEYGEGVGTLRQSGGDLGGDSETLRVYGTQYGQIAGTLTSRHDSSPCHDRGMNIVYPIGLDEEQNAVENGFGCLKARTAGGGFEGTVMQSDMKVRRLTPTECERLQGFPDGYTKITDTTADSSRYKALGNSMAVPVMRWLGERIQMVDDLMEGTK